MSEWRPIETAPKDGTVIFVWAPAYEWPEAVMWLTYTASMTSVPGEGYWTYAEELLADATDDCGAEDWTHWMPLPEPPDSKKPSI